MASCGIDIEEVLNVNSDEIQAFKAGLKDEKLRMGMQQVIAAIMKMVPSNPEDQLVSQKFYSEYYLKKC